MKMDQQHLKSEATERKEFTQQRKLPIDWTESEWFSVWLRLARGEYEPPPQPVVGS